jgi:small-conductance mechanosensitive channel
MLLVAAAGLAGLLGLAKALEPDPRGFGTHTQLGLRPCVFATMTGRLCPTCGMTTSFAWFVRGRIDRSWQANPAGCCFALLSVPFFAWLAASAIANEPVGFSSLSRPLMGLLVAAVALAVACWLIRSVAGISF